MPSTDTCMHTAWFQKLFVVLQVAEKAATVQPDLLQSIKLPQETLAIQADSGAPSEDEEDFEERQDDRANDPACIQCDDGGALLNVVWLANCGITSETDVVDWPALC